MSFRMLTSDATFAIFSAVVTELLLIILTANSSCCWWWLQESRPSNGCRGAATSVGSCRDAEIDGGEEEE